MKRVWRRYASDKMSASGWKTAATWDLKAQTIRLLKGSIEAIEDATYRHPTAIRTPRRFAEQRLHPTPRIGTARENAARDLPQDGGGRLDGRAVSPKYGGAGADFLSYVLAIEEVSAADGGVSNMMAATNSPVAVAIEENGTDQQKQDYLTKLTGGEWLGGIHLTEPHTGSEAAAIKTRAVRDGEDFILTGEKAFVLAEQLKHRDDRRGNQSEGGKGHHDLHHPTDNPGYMVTRKGQARPPN